MPGRHPCRGRTYWCVRAPEPPAHGISPRLSRSSSKPVHSSTTCVDNRTSAPAPPWSLTATCTNRSWTASPARCGAPHRQHDRAQAARRSRYRCQFGRATVRL